MDLVYIFGEPGVGKSTLMRTLLNGLPAHPSDKPVPHIWYGDGLAMELGARRESFSGTDAMAMSIQRKAEAYLHEQPARLVLAEGDRLANDLFFRQVQSAGYRLWLVHLWGEPGLVSVRRFRRGSQQNDRWVAGRRTKAYRLAGRWGHLPLNAAEDTDVLVAKMLASIPALAALHGAPERV